MLGALIGDIVGSVYEWRNRKDKGFPLFQPDCRMTDDSVMTAAVASAVLMGGLEELGAPIKLRAAIIPLTQFGSMAAMPLLILGLILNTSTLVTIGIAAFGLSTLFQLVTLPVELDASRRALQTIQQNGLLTADEYPMAKKTLTAAALTYVAALATSLAQLLRLVLIFGGRDRNDR